jgi:hypothetical protein
MERWNEEGIPRESLLWALTQPRLVSEHRRIDRCMLCRRPRVNEAALCDVCHATLDHQELDQAEKWLAGIGP